MPMPRKSRAKCHRTDCTNLIRRAVDKYCCSECQHEHQYQTYIAAWLAGEEDGSAHEVGVSRYVRKYLKRTRGECCAMCGWAEVNPHTGSVPVHLDHIDGDWKNNRPENLRFLCPNHHALTANYGARNRGMGRPFIVHKKAASVMEAAF